MKTQLFEKPSPVGPNNNSAGGRFVSRSMLAAVMLGLAGYGWSTAMSPAEETGGDMRGAQVLTRGPVHEAFAGTISFNPQPGVVVPKAPPNPIEEIPPAERPEGANVTWIPGYWAWDDERNDFLWVSGTWRSLPPGREWIVGYWGKTDQGYQWTSGYWADAKAEETAYLPEPPASLEQGPNVAAPSPDDVWAPGYWVYRENRYAWNPGCWMPGRADWDYIPAHYLWTPRGYLFVDAFWDYSVERRGVLFAPVAFEPDVYLQAGFSYSPLIALDLAMFDDHLFLRPSYCHYYFGDYYDNRYRDGGFVAAYAFRNSRSGFDPLFAHQMWEHRHDRNWSERYANNFEYRVAHADARPPRTWAAMRTLDPNSSIAKQNHLLAATPIDQLAKSKNGPLRFEKVSKDERQTLAKREGQVGISRDERRMLETKGLGAAPMKSGETTTMAKVRQPKSPIVGMAANRFRKGQGPPALPKASLGESLKSRPNERGPLSEEKTKPLTEPGRNEALPREKGNLTEPRKGEITPREKGDLTEPRKGETLPRERGDLTEPRKSEVVPRERSVQPEPRKMIEPQPRERSVQPEPRKIEPQPHERGMQPEPRKIEPQPHERAVQPERRMVEPPMNEKARKEPGPAKAEESGGKKEHNKNN